MTTLWVGLAVLVVLLFAAWRLRRASHTVDRIIGEERDRTITDAAREHLAEQEEQPQAPGHAAAPRRPDGR